MSTIQSAAKTPGRAASRRKRKRRMKPAESRSAATIARAARQANICLRVASIIVIAGMIFVGQQASWASATQLAPAEGARAGTARENLPDLRAAPLWASIVARQTSAESGVARGDAEPGTRARHTRATRSLHDTTKLLGVAGQTLELQCPRTDRIQGRSIEWRKDGLAVGKLNPRFKVDPRNGSLLIMNAQPKQDEGRYECSLVEATGEANQPRTIKNEQLELELLVAPRLAPFEFAADAQVGMKVVLTCAALQGQQPISFVWLKDGRPIANEPSQTARSLGQLHQQQLAARLGETAPDGRRALAETDQSEAGAKLMELAPLWDQSVRVRQADDYSILSIERLELAHSGKYTCSAENEAARVSHSAQLSINAPPQMTVEPKDADLVSGQSVVLDCSASGQPRPTVSWLRARESSNKQWDYLSVYDSSRYSNLANGSLAIVNVTQREQGFYLCSAKNGFGPEVTKLIKISVHEPAKFGLKYRTVEVRTEERANMVCLASGEPPVLIDWLDRDGNQIQPNDKRFIIDLNNQDDLRESTDQANSSASRLILARASRLDSGHYTCRATNKHGSDKMVTNLLVQDVPDKVTDLKVTNTTSTTVSIRWQLGFTGNSPITSYLVQYQSDDPLDDLLLAPDLAKPVEPAGSPAATGSLKAALEALGLAQSLDNADEAIDRTLVELTVEQSTSNLVVKDLSPFCVYRLRLAAINKIGLGEFSDWIRAKTEEAPPGGSALKISAIATGPNSVKLAWSPPERRSWNGQLTGFNIGYRPLDSGFELNKTIEWSAPNLQALVLDQVRPGQALHSAAISTAPPSNSSAPRTSGRHALRQHLRQLLALQQQELVAHLTNLQRSTTYLVWIQPINNRGLGPQSHAVSVKTLDDVPPSAPNIKVQSSTASSITLTWSLLSNFVSLANQYSLFYRRLPVVQQSRANASSFQPELGQQQLADSQSAASMEPFIERTISGQQLLASGNLFEAPSSAFVHHQQAQHYHQFVYNLDQLECGSAYELYMTTRNSVGKSEPSAVVTSRTLGQPPVAPSNKGTLFARIGASEVALNLAAWSNGGCPFTHISLKYKQSVLPVSAPVKTAEPHQELPLVNQSGPSWPVTTSLPSSLLVVLNAAHRATAKADQTPIYTLRNLLASTCYELEIVAYNAAGSTPAQYEFVTASQNGSRGGYSRREGVYSRGAVLEQSHEALLEHQAAFANQGSVGNQWISLTLVMLCFICLLVSSTFCYFRLADSWKRRRPPSSGELGGPASCPRESRSLHCQLGATTAGRFSKTGAWPYENDPNPAGGKQLRSSNDYCLRDSVSNTLKPKLCPASASSNSFTQSVSMKDFNMLPNDSQAVAPIYNFKTYRGPARSSADAKPGGTLRARLLDESPFGSEQHQPRFTGIPDDREQVCSLYSAALKAQQAQQHQDQLETYISATTAQAMDPVGQQQLSEPCSSSALNEDRSAMYEARQLVGQDQAETSYSQYAERAQMKPCQLGAYAIPSIAYGNEHSMELNQAEDGYAQGTIDACIQQLISQQQKYAMVVNQKVEQEARCLYGIQNCSAHFDSPQTLSQPRVVSANCGQSVIDSSSSSSGIDIGLHFDCASTTTRTSNSNGSQNGYHVQCDQSGPSQECFKGPRNS